MYYNILMSRGLNLRITDKTEEQLIKEGWLLSGKYDLLDNEDELLARENLKRWQAHHYEIISKIVDGRTQLFRKKS